MKDQVKVAILGCGRMGEFYAKTIQSEVEGVMVKTVYDVFPNKVEEIKEKYNIPVGAKDLSEIWNDPEIDMVMISTSTDTHAPIAIEAAKAKKDIYCDKPIDIDLKKVKAVYDAVKENGVQFCIGFNRRADISYKALKNEITEGNLGKLETIKLTSRDVTPPSAEYSKSSGGIFVDMIIHDFDSMRFFANCNAKEVYALGNCLLDENGPKGPEYVDTTITSILFEDGFLGVIDSIRRTTYHADYRAEVIGSLGKATVDNFKKTTLKTYTAKGEVSEHPPYSWLERWYESYPTFVQDVFAAYRKGEKMPTDIRDGIEANLMAEAANLSIIEKRAVSIAEILERENMVL